MKTIYTVTFQRVLNYGAVLQAYALSRFLKENGFDVKILDYAPFYFLWQSMRPSIGLKKTIEKYRKYRKFKLFRDKYLPLTDFMYFTKSQLSNLKKPFALICGSDQVWNFKITNNEFDPVFFLDFSSNDVRRIAYAASAGSIRLNNYANSTSHYLEKFTKIGVREKILKDDINEILENNQACVVVDPCLLIENYSEIYDFNRVPLFKYIVSYVVGSGEMLDIFNRKIEELKKVTDIKIIHLGAKAVQSADENLLDIGPSEWLAFIKNASFVITNSFHGTAFSVRLEKNFIFIPQINENLNSRQITLLKNIGLMDQMVPHDVAIVRIPNINYELITPRVNNIVKESKKFLIESLS